MIGAFMKWFKKWIIKVLVGSDPFKDYEIKPKLVGSKFVVDIDAIRNSPEAMRQVKAASEQAAKGVVKLNI